MRIAISVSPCATDTVKERILLEGRSFLPSSGGVVCSVLNCFFTLGLDFGETPIFTRCSSFVGLVCFVA